MPQPVDILDQPGPLPDEVIKADEYDDDTDPHITQAEREHPGLDMGAAWWDVELDAVVVRRDQLERIEDALRWEVRELNRQVYVIAHFGDRGVSLAAVDPKPEFEGAYIASRPFPRRGR